MKDFEGISSPFNKEAADKADDVVDLVLKEAFIGFKTDDDLILLSKGLRGQLMDDSILGFSTKGFGVVGSGEVVLEVALGSCSLKQKLQLYEA